MQTEKRRIYAQMIRFGFFGAINTAISYGIYAALLYVGLNFAASNFCALVIGIFVSFINQGKFVFGETSLKRFPRFVALWSGLYLLNISLIALFLEWGIDPYYGGALALVPVTAISFVCQRRFVFHLKNR